MAKPPWFQDFTTTPHSKEPLEIQESTQIGFGFIQTLCSLLLSVAFQGLCISVEIVGPSAQGFTVRCTYLNDGLCNLCVKRE